MGSNPHSEPGRLDIDIDPTAGTMGDKFTHTIACLVLSAVVFTPPTRTRQFCLVRVGGVNKL